MDQLLLQVVNKLAFLPLLNLETDDLLLGVEIEGEVNVVLVVFRPRETDNVGVPGLYFLFWPFFLGHVLLLDKDRLFLKLLENVLERHGFHAIDACNGLQILESDIHLILLPYDVLDEVLPPALDGALLFREVVAHVILNHQIF